MKYYSPCYSIKARPFSASSTTASFGSRLVPHHKDLSMNPKITFYKVDNYGRDGYINVPNGGFTKEWHDSFHQNYPSKATIGEFLRYSYKQPHFSRYRNDGFGRDSYIFDECGGFYKPSNYPFNSKIFIKSLREYKYDAFVNESLLVKKNDYQRYVKNFKPLKVIRQLNSERKIQRINSARLSKPKRQREKYVNPEYTYREIRSKRPIDKIEKNNIKQNLSLIEKIMNAIFKLFRK